MTIVRRTFPHQTGLDGELDENMKSRLQALRANGRLSLNELGRELQLSGTFLSSLLRIGARIRSVHIPRIAAAVERLERQYATQGAPVDTAAPLVDAPVSPPAAPEGLSLEALVRHANSRGFAVTFTPIEWRAAAPV
ncbi:hypothetical protein [Mesorhizobium sp. M0802]|uniref:hypothetical protein n=1 Tax=Mesorhizobium sp. M0802 TaxID=2957001 RepID=UPI003337F556